MIKTQCFRALNMLKLPHLNQQRVITRNVESTNTNVQNSARLRI